MLDRIKTERLLLRRWKPEDRVPFALINADFRVMKFFARPLTQKDSDGFIDRVEAHFNQHGFGFWALEKLEDGRLIGLAGLAKAVFKAPFTPTVEIGWRLAHDAWGRGYATEAAAKAMEVGFDGFSLPEIVAFTVPDNQRSRRVMEKLAMCRNEEEDFDHPGLPEGHRFQKHVLYRISRTDWVRKRSGRA